MSGNIDMFEQQTILATSFLPADLRYNILTRVNEVDNKIKNSSKVRENRKISCIVAFDWPLIYLM